MNESHTTTELHAINWNVPYYSRKILIFKNNNTASYFVFHIKRNMRKVAVVCLVHLHEWTLVNHENQKLEY
jgi:hypothetical protein